MRTEKFPYENLGSSDAINTTSIKPRKRIYSNTPKINISNWIICVVNSTKEVGWKSLLPDSIINVNSLHGNIHETESPVIHILEMGKMVCGWKSLTIQARHPSSRIKYKVSTGEAKKYKRLDTGPRSSQGLKVNTNWEGMNVKEYGQLHKRRWSHADARLQLEFVSNQQRKHSVRGVGAVGRDTNN